MLDGPNGNNLLKQTAQRKLPGGLHQEKPLSEICLALTVGLRSCGCHITSAERVDEFNDTDACLHSAVNCESIRQLMM
jgi:hypothetical protein